MEVRSHLEKIHVLLRPHYKLALVILVIFLGIVLSFWHAYNPPSDFPAGSVITIEEGKGLSQIAQILERERIISSKFLFKNLVIVLGGERGLTAGDYYFAEPIDVLTVARRIAGGIHGLLPLRVTIPEGYNIFDIATHFESRFDTFSQREFLLLAKDKEGYLFPDTYFFMPNVKAQEVVRVMEENFYRRLREVHDDIVKFETPLDDIIIVASILEQEAMTTESRRIISGILWRRLSLGMPLQVDATFQYVNGKASLELTTEDLQIDSPYNTYKYPGLPPTPIANPGLDSIKAAVNPIPSRYLYFLSDKDGTMHYATTHEQHVENRRRYLGK
jgi:UPF0755 protein